MALDFDGSSQYIRVTQNSGLPIYNDTSYSVCGWVKAPAQDDKRIFSEGQTGSNNTLLTIGSGRTADGKTDKVLVFIRTDASTVLLNVYSTTTVFDSTWHFFCWVDNNGDADLYIDGTLDATNFNYTRSGSFTLNRTGIAAIIRASISYYLDGELFDIRCYNRCLTANEVQEIYHNRGADRVWQGLVGRWRLDEAPSGTPAPLLLDSMDSTSGWTASNGAVSLNTTTKVEGIGSISLSKTNTSYDYCYMYKSISSTNLTGQTLKVWVYIKDSATLAKINDLKLWFGQNSLNRYVYIYTDSLSVGWNAISVHVDDFSVYNGSPTKTDVKILYFTIATINVTDTLSADDVLFDFYRAGDYVPNSIIDLSGNGNHGTPYNSPVYQASPHRLRRGVLVS